jgi:hypothetical protein
VNVASDKAVHSGKRPATKWRRKAIPAKVVRQLLVECGHRCAVCGFVFNTEKAHVEPWRISRDDKPENLICLCPTCHAIADRGEWGKQVLRDYKRAPWVSRYGHFQFLPPKTVALRVTVDLDLSEFDETKERWIRLSVAKHFDVPEKFVVITTREPANSIRLTMILPAEAGEVLLKAFEDRDAKSNDFFQSLSIVDVRSEDIDPEIYRAFGLMSVVPHEMLTSVHGAASEPPSKEASSSLADAPLVMSLEEVIVELDSIVGRTGAPRTKSKYGKIGKAIASANEKLGFIWAHLKKSLQLGSKDDPRVASKDVVRKAKRSRSPVDSPITTLEGDSRPAKKGAAKGKVKDRKRRQKSSKTAARPASKGGRPTTPKKTPG